MIIAKLISGLGNQLFQYTIARQLSIKNKTNLKLDISFFDDQNLRSFKLNHYNIKAEIASEEDVKKLIGIYSSQSLNAKVSRRIQHALPKNKRRLYKEGKWWVFEEELLNCSSPVYLDGYWQHYKYFENIDRSILDELTIKDDFTASIEKQEQEITANKNSVSVHIRRGDYISHPVANQLMGVLPLSYYQCAIKHFKEQLGSPTFYFFSDDLKWVQENLKVDAETRFVDGAKDYIDLELMSKCSHNIIANSSFSWWGAFLNQNKNKIVIAPRKWVVPDKINERIKIQFPAWIHM